MSGSAADVRYPPLEPYEHGMLDVGDGHHIYWESCGNPRGKPALFVHGGPGSGCRTGTRRYFDPERYRLIMFDQRGSGRSLPHASDPAADMGANTTEHLLRDMERLREHLGIERWLLNGGSWGSTLLLAYAERFPERVSEIVVVGVTTSRPAEIEWLYGGLRRFFPEQWERFRAGAPESARDGDLYHMLAGYSRLMNDPDPAVREKAAADWCAWEDTAISLEPNGVPNAYGARPPKAVLALVRICAHYFSNKMFLDDEVLLREAGRLKGIPGVLIHGRLDLSGPLDTAWDLAQRWPDAEIVLVMDSGHTGSDEFRAQWRGALDRFASTPH
ncbi:MAG TPA: prolyl aminopeptidase [Actinocrinis sp.]|nr:prolyl aminopeptidase [Actinocrinis sp.]